LLKIFALFIFSMLPFGALAEQTYTITFQNKSSRTVWIEAQAGKCMQEWNVPAKYTSLNPGYILGPYTIKDKNSGSCLNASKLGVWNIVEDLDNLQNSLKIGFLHQIKNGHWTTYFNANTSGSPYSFISGISCNSQPCLNPYFYTSSDGFPMVVTIEDRYN